MQVRDKGVKKLLDHYKQISLLGKTESLLGWDLNVNLPTKALQSRSEQLSFLTALITDKWHDSDFRQTLESLGDKSRKLSQKEQAVVRNLQRAGKFYYRVPKEVVVKSSEITSKTFMAWQKSREENDFTKFLPRLEEIISLNIEIAGHLGYQNNPYDALLDLYEQDLTAAECLDVFTYLREETGLLLRKIKSSKYYEKETKVLSKTLVYPKSDQERVALFVLEKMGYDFEAGRMDVSTHPFTSNFGSSDVRITNRYKESDFVESLMVALHEGGHALYEQGVDPEYSDTPLGGGVSLGIHESQSRFWENQIGRSEEFVGFITPILKSFYPNELQGRDENDIYRRFNLVRPSLIRVEADEVTYNLHIALRFELENKLINQKIKPSDLPEIWREEMKSYLGVTPQTDTEGVLQDVHWSYGNFGYFPTYSLGNLYAAQFSEEMSRSMNMKDLIRKGNLNPILAWQRENIHKHGSLYWPKELVKKVTGKPLSAKYFVNYLKQKYSKIYN